jgi:hypothetical protein
MTNVPGPGGTEVTRVTDPPDDRMFSAKNWNSLLPVPVSLLIIFVKVFFFSSALLGN